MDRGIMYPAHCGAGCGIYRRSGTSTVVCPRVLGLYEILLCLYDVYDFTILYLPYMLCMTTCCVLFYDADGCLDIHDQQQDKVYTTCFN